MKDRVQSYYNANTRIFLASEARKSRRRFLHRQLALPQASATPSDGVHQTLVAALDAAGTFENPTPLILDLGCGVGGTLSWLAATTTARVAGITLSEVQAAIAQTRFAGEGSRCRIAVGSFEDPGALAPICRDQQADAAYMIESFVHAGEPDAVFKSVSRHARAGAVLVIIDDFPAPDLEARLGRPGARRIQRLVDDFRDGWRINTFKPAPAVLETAASLGWHLEAEHDLTPYVVTSRFRDLLARSSRGVLRPLKGRINYVDNVVGGGALQRLIRMRLIRYQMLVLRFAPATE